MLPNSVCACAYFEHVILRSVFQVAGLRIGVFEILRDHYGNRSVSSVASLSDGDDVEDADEIVGTRVHVPAFNI